MSETVNHTVDITDQCVRQLIFYLHATSLLDGIRPDDLAKTHETLKLLAKEAGIDSFWYKEPLENSLLSVLDRTMAGESVYPEDTPVLKVGEALSTEFTEGELKVLRELTGGDTDEEIANTLNFSIWTVRKYVKIMLEKTGFKSRTQLAVAARESGLVIRGY